MFCGLLMLHTARYVCGMGEVSSAIEEEKRAAFDVRLVDANLNYSYEQRVIHHQEALDLILESEKAGYQVNERWIVRKLAAIRQKQESFGS
jgi:hypothetical protein